MLIKPSIEKIANAIQSLGTESFISANNTLSTFAENLSKDPSETILMLQNFLAVSSNVPVRPSANQNNSVNNAPQDHVITKKSQESMVSINDSDASLFNITDEIILPEKTKTRGRPKTTAQKNFKSLRTGKWASTFVIKIV